MRRNSNLASHGILVWASLNTYLMMSRDPECDDAEGDMGGSVQSNILTMVGVMGVLGSFFALGALLFTLWEVMCLEP